MAPQLAALICILFILYLFWVDRKRSEGVSSALWIPLIWMFLAGSRYVSQWLNLGAPVDPADLYLEGSPVDRIVFLLLMVAGVIVLSRRRLAWGHLLTHNKWIWLYFLFGAVSVLWSDYPFVSFKRLIKASGTVMMALVILTEKRPYEAVGVLLRRLAFLLVPLSILLIKYYPAFGRAYNRWTGEVMFTGMATEKNGLGQICLITGIYFCWAFLLRGGKRLKLGGRLSILMDVVFVGMIAWLLPKANSATSLVCLVLAAGILLASRMPSVAREPRRIMALGMAAVCLFGVFEVALDLSDSAVALLGRDQTLTTRVPMWEDLREMAANPLVGFGYESFWLGDRLEVVWEKYGRLHDAHNGYLETYLNLGLIGLGLIVGSMLSGLLKVRRHLSRDYPAAILRLCFIASVALYNYAEATFYGVSNMYLLFFLGIIDISGQENWHKREAAAGSRNSDYRVPKRRLRCSPSQRVT
jgi:O-antigen ligase